MNPQVLVSPERASHWYRNDSGVWSPFYEIESANGKGLRPVTLRDARKVSAVPSVTNVLNIMAKPGLEAWKATQYIEAALTLPKAPDEPLDAYARRVVEDAEAKSATARDFGTRIHKAIECHLTKMTMPEDKELAPFIGPVLTWVSGNVMEIYATEFIVGNKELGYAGRLDLDCNLRGFGRALIDFKTQGIRNGKEPAFYNEWGKQLAAYWMACPTDNTVDSLVSVVIDSMTPRLPFFHRWEDQDRHFAMFKHCLELWKDEKDYDPANP